MFWKYFFFVLIIRNCLTENYTGHELWAIWVRDVHDIKILEDVIENYQIDIWSQNLKENSKLLLHINAESKKNVARILKSFGINISVSIPDIQSKISEQKFRQSQNNWYKTSLKHDKYYDYPEIELYLDEVSKKHVNLVSKLSIGFTHENRSIAGVAITKGNKGMKPAFVYECGIHAREWISTAVCLFIIDQLTLEINSNLVERYEFYIFPVMNPDGYQYTWDKDRLWRKNRSQTSWKMFEHCIGVDLNRNFQTPFFCDLGSSHNPCVDGYCGDYAFSEEETQALRAFTMQLGSRLKMYTALHSFSQLWMYPYGYTSTPPANYQQLHYLANLGAKAVKEFSGTEYIVGQLYSTIYESAGSSIDWVYDTLRTPYVFILELPDEGDEGFLIAPEKIYNISSETWHGLKAVINGLE